MLPWDIGFKRFEMYSGVILFHARYVSPTLLYLIQFGTVNQRSFLNIGAEGAGKSCLIMRAERFCSFDIHSI